jgi:hypothetical protein
MPPAAVLAGAMVSESGGGVDEDSQVDVVDCCGRVE